MSQKWNLQDIRPAEPRKKRTPTEPLATKPRPPEVPREEAPEEIEPVVVSNGTKKKNRSFGIALGVFFVVIALGAVVSIIMGGAEITVNPKYREPNVNATFQAVSTPQNQDDLVYEILTLEAEGERQVTATGQEEVKSQAEGTIMIYNNHSADSVRLVTNTRFESPDGLIFKIKDAAVIPGYTTEGGEKKPGVVTAEVYADEVGEQYNLQPTRFTIPGFAGEPEFDNLYGESVSSFTGGFDGQKFIIDESELQTAQQALRLELRNSLLERIESEKPAGFVQYQGATTFTYESLPTVEYGSNLATIKEKTTMRIPLFPEAAFATFIAQATVPGYEGEPVRIQDPQVMEFEYESATTSSSNIAADPSISFKLIGRPLIVWEYDGPKLKADLVGKNHTALTAILGGYPAIEQAKAVIRPFWKSTFPTSLDEIELIEVIKPEE